MRDALENGRADSLLLAQARKLLAQIVAQAQLFGGGARVFRKDARCLVEGSGVALRRFGWMPRER